MRTRAILLALLLCSIGCFAQNWRTVYSPVKGTQTIPGESFPIEWFNMDNGKWRIEIRLYTINVNSIHAHEQPWFKTHDQLPHDFMYSPVKVYHHDFTYKQNWEKSDGTPWFAVPCENSWKWTGPTSLPLNVTFSDVDPFIATLSTVDFQNPVNTNDLINNRIEIRGFGPGNQRFYTYVDIVDPDPNMAPVGPGFVIQCHETGVDVCLESTRDTEVDAQYQPIATGPETRLMQWYRLKDDDDIPSDLDAFIRGQYTSAYDNPTSHLVAIGGLRNDLCLPKFQAKDDRPVDLLFVQANRAYGKNHCLNPTSQIYDLSPLTPVVVFNPNGIDFDDPILSATGNDFPDGEVYSDEALICDELKCKLPKTKYDFPRPDELSNSIRILMNNSPLQNADIWVSGISWKAIPDVYNNFQGPHNEDFLSYENLKPKVCFTDLNDAYINDFNEKEMTYEGTYQIKIRYEGQIINCQKKMRVKVKQNPLVAPVVGTFNQIVRDFMDDNNLLVTQEAVCDMLYNVYTHVYTPRLAVDVLTDTLYQPVAGMVTHQLFDSLAFYFSESVSTKPVVDAYLDMLGIRIRWENPLVLSDTNSLLSGYLGTVPVGDTLFLTCNLVDKDGAELRRYVNGLVGNLGTIAPGARKGNDASDTWVEIYPNPSKQFVQVSTNAAFPVNYQIISLTGELVKDGQLLSGLEKVDLADLKPSVYIMKVLGSDHQFSESRLIKIN